MFKKSHTREKQTWRVAAICICCYCSLFARGGKNSRQTRVVQLVCIISIQSMMQVEVVGTVALCQQGGGWRLRVRNYNILFDEVGNWDVRGTSNCLSNSSTVTCSVRDWHCTRNALQLLQVGENVLFFSVFSQVHIFTVDNNKI